MYSHHFTVIENASQHLRKIAILVDIIRLKEIWSLCIMTPRNQGKRPSASHAAALPSAFGNGEEQSLIHEIDWLLDCIVD